MLSPLVEELVREKKPSRNTSCLRKTHEGTQEQLEKTEKLSRKNEEEYDGLDSNGKGSYQPNSIKQHGGKEICSVTMQINQNLININKTKNSIIEKIML